MAGKKPSKPMTTQSKQVVQDPAIYGSLIKFIGTKSSRCICEVCNRSIVRGIVRVKADLFFCSASCARDDWSKSQTAPPGS
jgi:hypothetical protein